MAHFIKKAVSYSARRNLNLGYPTLPHRFPSSLSRFSSTRVYKPLSHFPASSEAESSDLDEPVSKFPSSDLPVFLQLLSQAKSKFASQGEALAFLKSSPVAKPNEGLLCSVLWELRRDWESAVLAFRWAGDSVLESPRAWHLILWVLGRQRRFDLAWMFLRRMHKKSLLTRKAFLIMMERYASANETGKAIKTFHALDRFNIEADLAVFYALLCALCKNKNIEEAEELLLLKQKYFPLKTAGFNIVLDGWCNILVDLIEARRVWREMAKYCILPDGTSYTHMIGCLAKHGHLSDTLRLYNEMKKRGFTPTLKVYNYLIFVLAQESCMKEAHDIINMIIVAGLQPDLKTYNCMILPLCEAHKLDEARETLKIMISSGVRPSMDTYHAFIKIENFEGIAELIEKMKEYGYMPNRSTFLLIVNKFFRLGELESVLKMWREMRKYVIPDSADYITMIKGLATAGRIPKAMELYGEMMSKGFPADPELEQLFKGFHSIRKNRWGFWGSNSKGYIRKA